MNTEAKPNQIREFITFRLKKLVQQVKDLKKGKNQSEAEFAKVIQREKRQQVKKGIKLLEEVLNAPIGHLVLKATNFKKHVDTRIEYAVLKRVVSLILQRKGVEIVLPQNEIDGVKKMIDEIVFKEMDDNISSVVMVVHADNLVKINETQYCLKSTQLRNRKLPDGLQLNSKNRFLNQQSAKCLGTGFFVSEDIIATAAHVIEDCLESLGTHIRFVRNLSMLKDEQLSEEGIIVSAEDVFKPVSQTISPSCYDCSETKSDWAIMKVISKTGRKSPVFTRLEKKAVEEEQELYCLGHGLGLPMKVSCIGKVIKIDPSKDCFDTDLTIFSGNSGSPVFDAKTHRVVGILARGTKEMVKIGNTILFKKFFKPEEGEECQQLKPVIAALAMLKDKDNNSKTLINTDQMILAQNFAPYTYCRYAEYGTSKLYELYILIPVPENVGVHFCDPEEHPSSIRIKCLATTENNHSIQIGQQYFARKCYSFPIDEWNGGGSLEDIEVNVRVVNLIDGGAVNGTLFFGDSDDKSQSSLTNSEELAFNCPYAFLSNPGMGTDENFDPRLLVPMKGYQFDDEMEKVHITDSSEGSCRSLVVLHKTSSQDLSIAIPAKTHESKFCDDDEVEGSFQAITYLAEDLTDAEAMIEVLEGLFNGSADNSNNNDDENKKSKVTIRTKDTGGTPLKPFTD